MELPGNSASTAAAAAATTAAVVSLAMMSILVPTCCAEITFGPFIFGYSTTSATTTTSGHNNWKDPEIRLAEFFYISFPKSVAEEFIACLCDASSLKCAVSYKLRENQTSGDFPFPYRALSLRQTRLTSDDFSQYRPYFICDVLNFVPGDDISCDRQLATDQTCETTGKCQSYTANFTSEQCGLECSEIAWLSAFNVPITYSSFEYLALVSQNGTCFSRNNPVKNNNPGSDEGIELSVALGVGVSCGAVMVVAAAVITWIVCKRKRSRGKSNDVGESTASNPEHFSGSHNIGFVDERDEDQYHEIDDIAAGVRSPEHFDEPDDEGYNIIREESDPEEVSRVQKDKTTRPLPLPPDGQCLSPGESLPSIDAASSLEPSAAPPHYSSGAFSSYPTSLTEPASASAQSTESSNTTAALTSTESSSSSSASSTAPLVPPSKLATSNPAPGLKKGSTSEASPPFPWRANPVAHKFPCPTTQYDYLGLVNIRSGHPRLSNQSQLKLVRKKDGGMELVTVQDDLPAVDDLCSGLQLIGLRNGSLCVLGLLSEPPSDDYHNYFRILKLQSDSCSYIDPSSYDTSGFKQDGDDNEEEIPPPSDLSTKHAIYLGPLELESDHIIRSTESGGYLKVLDLATAEDCSDSGGYLRVLDIDEANITDNDGEYLTVLDF